MIAVEFRRPDQGAHYATVATLRVEDDSSWTLSGDLDDSILEVSIAASYEPSGQIRFADDPARWARLAHRAFRTPYLVVEVMTDTDPDARRREHERRAVTGDG